MSIFYFLWLGIMFLWKLNRLLERWLSNRINYLLHRNYYVFWDKLFWSYDKSRIIIWKWVNLCNALLNVNSGCISILDYVFCWHNVSIITWTHNYKHSSPEKRQNYPKKWNDIIIEEWVWICSNATILGPCKIWKNSVVACWAVILGGGEYPKNSLIWGIPARVIKEI